MQSAIFGNKHLAAISSNKHLTLTAILVLAIGILFWTGSRYPQLNEKALMGGDTMLENPLSFESIVDIQAGDGDLKKILYTTINWADENTNGMAFGILFGAALMTMIVGLKRKSFRSGWANTLLGMGIGAPMGVCVNCAAPIAKGMHDSGTRLETTLAAMFSSPTLNVIVLTILISIFPPYLVIIKLAVTILFIAVIIPWCCRLLFTVERDATFDGQSCSIDFNPPAPDGTWIQTAAGVIMQFGRNLVYLVIRTVPLMFVAGLLGAIFVNYFPLETLKDIPVSLPGAIVVSFIGVLLPLPIALDLVLSASLLASGLPVFYVAILLFSLGIYSIYPFFILWTSISRKVAIVLVPVVMIVSIVAGYLSDYWYMKELAELYEFLEN